MITYLRKRIKKFEQFDWNKVTWWCISPAPASLCSEAVVQWKMLLQMAHLVHWPCSSSRFISFLPRDCAYWLWLLIKLRPFLNDCCCSIYIYIVLYPWYISSFWCLVWLINCILMFICDSKLELPLYPKIFFNFSCISSYFNSLIVTLANCSWVSERFAHFSKW